MEPPAPRVSPFAYPFLAVAWIANLAWLWAPALVAYDLHLRGASLGRISLAVLSVALIFSHLGPAVGAAIIGWFVAEEVAWLGIAAIVIQALGLGASGIAVLLSRGGTEATPRG